MTSAYKAWGQVFTRFASEVMGPCATKNMIYSKEGAADARNTTVALLCLFLSNSIYLPVCLPIFLSV